MATASVTITITAPTVDLQDMQQLLCDRWAYTGFLPDGTTAETKIQFIKRKTVDFWKSEYKAQKQHNTVIAAEAGAVVQTVTNNNYIDSNVILT